MRPPDAAWIRNQRRARTLTVVQQLLLEALPHWSWAPQDESWDLRGVELATFIRREQRMPRVRASSKSERALAHWFSRQRILHREGRLKHARAITFRALICVAHEGYRSQNVQTPARDEA